MLGMPMDRDLSEDWPEGHLVVVPHAWRDDGFWIEMQSQAQERIGATLREMYAEMIQQPLSLGLEVLAHQIGSG